MKNLKHLPTLIVGMVVGALMFGAISMPGASAAAKQADRGGAPFVYIQYHELHDYGVYWDEIEQELGAWFELNVPIGMVPAGTHWRMDNHFMQEVAGEWIALGGVIE